MTDFYKDKKVVVTGGAGMVGSHLVEKLLQAGASVVVVADNLSRGKNIIEDKRVQFLRADASSYSSMLFVLRDAFALFNLAATVAGVTHNQNNNLNMFDSNVQLATVPIRAANDMRTPHVLQTSSVCVYPDGETNPCDDTILKWGDPNSANAGYAEAKRDGERAVRWSSLNHAVIVRPSNIYGPRDYFDDKAHVIPALIKKVLADGDTIEVFGTGQEEREFLYVEDAAEGMMHALEHGLNKKVYNLGTNGETCVTIDKLLAKIQGILDTNKKIVYSDRYKAGDNKRWSLCSKIHGLGWYHKWSLDSGLRKMAEWYLGEMVKVEATNSLDIYFKYFSKTKAGNNRTDNDKDLWT